MPVEGQDGFAERRTLAYMSWQGLSMLVQAGTQLGVIALLARFLAPEDFGLVAAANIAITLVQTVSEGGIGSAVVQRPQISPGFVGAAISVSLLISAVCYALLGIFAIPFQALMHIESLGIVVLVLGLGAFLSGISSVLEGLLQRDLHFSVLFRVNLISSVLGYALPAVVLAIAGAGVWALVFATLGRIATKLLLVAWQYSGSLRPRWEPTAARDLLRFGFGLTQDRFWNWTSAQTAPFAIGLLFGQAQLGQFYMGSQLAVLPVQYLATIVSAVYFPLISRSLADKKLVTTQFLSVVASVFVLASAIGMLLAINSDFIVQTAFGSGWNDAVIVFEILCLGAGIRSSIQICDALNIARGDVYALANRRAATAVLLFVGMYVLRSFGLAGAAWAMISSHTLMLALTVGLAVVGLQIRMVLAAPFIWRLGGAFLLILAVDVPGFWLRESGTVDGVPLLAFGVIANVAIALPVALILSDRVRRAVLHRYGRSTASKDV